MHSNHNRLQRGALLSRLNPQQQEQTHSHQGQQHRDLLHGIRRDLEYLLNTKCPLPERVNQHKWVKQSALQYGMVDFMDINYVSASGQQQLSACIRECINAFEPRLQHCEVEVDANSNFSALLSIHISAEVVLQDYNNPIYFETVLQPEQALFTVKKGTFA